LDLTNLKQSAAAARLFPTRSPNKMFEGTVISINIAADAAAPMKSVDEARAVPGHGLEGDRYYDNEGTFSKPKPEPDRELTLIEAEAIEALRREFSVEFDLGSSRRNIVTRGVPLNHLVGREFWIGEVKIRGLRLCEPCAHLQSLSHPKVLPGLVHRGGLRAQILSEGLIRVGQIVRESEDG
jgi:MOSC domain-containing protein YiiM